MTLDIPQSMSVSIADDESLSSLSSSRKRILARAPLLPCAGPRPLEPLGVVAGVRALQTLEHFGVLNKDAGGNLANAHPVGIVVSVGVDVVDVAGTVHRWRLGRLGQQLSELGIGVVLRLCLVNVVSVVRIRHAFESTPAAMVAHHVYDVTATSTSTPGCGGTRDQAVKVAQIRPRVARVSTPVETARTQVARFRRWSCARVAR